MSTNSDLSLSHLHIARKTAVLPALAAAFLGVFFIWGVGFSHIEAVHNAAHDTRHSNAFPCH